MWLASSAGRHARSGWSIPVPHRKPWSRRSSSICSPRRRNDTGAAMLKALTTSFLLNHRDSTAVPAPGRGMLLLLLRKLPSRHSLCTHGRGSFISAHHGSPAEFSAEITRRVKYQRASKPRTDLPRKRCLVRLSHRRIGSFPKHDSASPWPHSSRMQPAHPRDERKTGPKA
jgi:hypothetical protein